MYTCTKNGEIISIQYEEISQTELIHIINTI